MKFSIVRMSMKREESLGEVLKMLIFSGVEEEEPKRETDIAIKKVRGGAAENRAGKKFH